MSQQPLCDLCMDISTVKQCEAPTLLRYLLRRCCCRCCSVFGSLLQNNMHQEYANRALIVLFSACFGTLYTHCSSIVQHRGMPPLATAG